MRLQKLIPGKIKNWIKTKTGYYEKQNEKKISKINKKIEIFPDDVWLVSYPKSGNTWLRFLIGNYLTGNQCDFTNCNKIVPDLHQTNQKQCSNLKRPRFIKSHFPFTPDYKRVVYLVRDGRDVGISYYFHLIKKHKIPKETNFKDYLVKFNNGDLSRQYSSWSNHVNSWLDRKLDNILLVKYEEMKIDPISKITEILQFARLPVDEQAVVQAVNYSNFENMKKLEKEQQYSSPNLANSDLNMSFVRSGKVGQYHDFFDDKSMQIFERIHSSALKRLGYL